MLINIQISTWLLDTFLPLIDRVIGAREGSTHLVYTATHSFPTLGRSLRLIFIVIFLSLLNLRMSCARKAMLLIVFSFFLINIQVLIVSFSAHLSRFKEAVLCAVWQVTPHQHHTSTHVGIKVGSVADLGQNLTRVVIFAVT